MQSLEKRDRHSMNYKYRDDGYITEVEDQQGFLTRYTYDENDNRISWTDAEDNDGDGLPETETYVRDGFDRVVKTIDRGGNDRRLFYDPAGDRMKADG